MSTSTHLHHTTTAMPKPDKMLQPKNALHSLAAKASTAPKTKGVPADNFGPVAMARRQREARIAAVDWDKAPITTASMREPLVLPRHTSMRPGAEDYRQCPSLVGSKRVPYTARSGA